MILKPGQTVLKTEFFAMNLRVGDLLGEGGQGEVYAAEQDGKRVAVKWYTAKAIRNDPGLRERLRQLRDHHKRPSEKFLWPIDIVASEKVPDFGYVMPFREERFIEIDHANYGDQRPSLLERAKAGIEIVEAYQKLHAAGLCYRDINFGNVAFDVQTGETRICDCDNVGENNAVIRGGVVGTREFMAPEIVVALAEKRSSRPNFDTDLWSLAVLLFRLFLVDHPLKGRREALGETDQRTLFGDRALFVYDPHDRSNEPVPGWHDTLMRLWQIYPQLLRDLFTQAFTAGIHNPGQRVRETVWLHLMARLRDTIHHCPHCMAENFHDGQTTQSCWHCSNTVPKPLCLKLKNHSVVMANGAELYGQHLNAKNASDANKAVARVVVHPRQAHILGLENRDGAPWHAVTPKGKEITIHPGVRVTLRPGVQIDFGGVKGVIE
jgi:DNA-binding helix-hairpin-helix protein with protein kinase domain